MPSEPWYRLRKFAVKKKRNKTLQDYVRFLQLHLRNLLGRDDAGYTADMITQLHQAQIIIDSEQAYATGWGIQKVNDETLHWHNGSAGTFYAYMAINPERKKGVVIVIIVDD